MTSTEFISLLDQFQTTIVGFVGFFGVIWTLRATARNAQADHERQLETRRNVLRRVLAAELRNYLRAMNKNLASQYPSDVSISVGRVNRMFSEQLSQDLGLLDLNEVDIIVNALISLDGMEHHLENMAMEASDKRFVIPAASWEEFSEINAKVAEALTYAVPLLETNGEV